MLSSLASFFGIFGVDILPPTDFSSFIPWLFQLVLAAAIIAFVFRFFASVARATFGRRWL